MCRKMGGPQNGCLFALWLHVLKQTEKGLVQRSLPYRRLPRQSFGCELTVLKIPYSHGPGNSLRMHQGSIRYQEPMGARASWVTKYKVVGWGGGGVNVSK